MPSIPQFLVLSFLAAILITLNFASPAVSAVIREEAPVEQETPSFQQLLNTVSEDTLHAMLHHHLPPKYQHGVFPKDKAVIEAVHSVDPPMATRLLRLAKRQNLTSTSTSHLSSSALSTTSLTSSSTSASSSQSVTSSVTSSASSNPSTSLSTSASSSASSTTQTSSSSASTAPSTSTSSGISTSTTSQALSSSTSLILSTTTLSNGQRSTVTQVTVVGGSTGISTPSGIAGVSTTVTGAPSLQSGGASKNGVGMMGAVIGGAMAGFLVL